jgi:hypothetical protein
VKCRTHTRRARGPYAGDDCADESNCRRGIATNGRAASNARYLGRGLGSGLEATRARGIREGSI